MWEKMRLSKYLSWSAPKLLLILLSVVVGSAGAGVAQNTAVPTVVLLGDSIRLGYAPVVARRLEGRVQVISPEPNGGDSANLLRNLDTWVDGRPAIIHFNAGLHDLKIDPATGKYQVPLPDYARNLKKLVAQLRQTGATIVFADTTPIIDARHAARKAGFNRFESDVQRYNAAAIQVMFDAGVPVHDLHGLVDRHGAAKIMEADGTHYTADGYELLGEAVADCIARHLTIRSYAPLPSPPSGPEAGRSYRQAEAERDRKVPEVYRKIPLGEFQAPATASSWNADRPRVLKAVLESLGDSPARPSPVRARVVSRELRRTHQIEKVQIDNGVEGEISALLLVPDRLERPAPAILWLHSSTPDHTQIIIPGTNGGDESLGEAFVRAGYVVLSPDAYWHGDRSGTGPSGTAETGREEQESLHKLNLWLGRTLWGMFVRDDQVALDFLVSRPEVDKTRIGTTGMSMGSTRAWWLAAVDERIAAAVGVACFTRYQNLISHGQLRQHGVYYFTNGLLRKFDTEGVLALMAPRPFLALTGDLDAGSPVDGIRVLEDRVGRVYAALGNASGFRSVVYPDTGHAYTPEMRAEMLAWFQRWLNPAGSN